MTKQLLRRRSYNVKAKHLHQKEGRFSFYVEVFLVIGIYFFLCYMLYYTICTNLVPDKEREDLYCSTQWVYATVYNYFETHKNHYFPQDPEGGLRGVLKILDLALSGNFSEEEQMQGLYDCHKLPFERFRKEFLGLYYDLNFHLDQQRERPWVPRYVHYGYLYLWRLLARYWVVYVIRFLSNSEEYDEYGLMVIYESLLSRIGGGED